MYVIEITEEKADHIVSHIGKAVKCLNKVMDCFEDMREESSYGERSSDAGERMSDNFDEEPQYHSRMHRRGYRQRGGRYSQY